MSRSFPNNLKINKDPKKKKKFKSKLILIKNQCHKMMLKITKIKLKLKINK